MKTIEQLAEEHLVDNPQQLTIYPYIAKIEHVEALCQAYMADRLSGLKPCNYKWFDKNMEHRLSGNKPTEEHAVRRAMYLALCKLKDISDE